jgi:hypothetical protein
MNTKNKIQSLLITHLLKYGQIELKLPDGMTLEIGVTQEEDNQIKIVEDYCWVITSRNNRSTNMDSFNMGLRFEDEEDIIVFEDRFITDTGDTIRRLDVV